METDTTNPEHYKQHPSGVECIEITEHMTLCSGNAVKYIWRAGLKTEDRAEDLRKAAWYIQRELDGIEKSKPQKSAESDFDAITASYESLR
jgi:hypothetical protein